MTFRVLIQWRSMHTIYNYQIYARYVHIQIDIIDSEVFLIYIKSNRILEKIKCNDQLHEYVNSICLNHMSTLSTAGYSDATYFNMQSTRFFKVHVQNERINQSIVFMQCQYMQTFVVSIFIRFFSLFGDKFLHQSFIICFIKHE